MNSTKNCPQDAVAANSGTASVVRSQFHLIGSLALAAVLAVGTQLGAAGLEQENKNSPQQDQKQGDPKNQSDKKQDGPQQDKKKQDGTADKGDDPKDGDAEKAKRQEKLDKDLFKDLGGDLFDTIGDKNSDKDQQSDKSGDELFDDLGAADGEDVGADGDPLVRIGQLMRRVENLLKEARSGQSTQELQKQIATDLDRLIAQAEKQQQQSQSSQQQNQDPSQSNNPQQGTAQPQPGQPQGNPQQSAAQSQSPGQAPQDSTDGPRPPAGPDSASMAAIRDLMEKTPWGDLPERIRQTMLQSPTEQMLPEYAEQIRKYFERLAKRNGR